jgi:hypothetical protein
MDKKMLWMGLAGLVLLLMLLGCGGICFYYIAKVWRSHTNEVDPQSSRRGIQFARAASVDLTARGTPNDISYSPSTSQPLRRWRRTNWFASATLVTFSSAASHSSIFIGKRVARQPSSTDSVSGPE